MDSCVICLEPIAGTSFVCIFGCKHALHTRCAALLKDQMTNPRCPICQNSHKRSALSTFATMCELPSKSNITSEVEVRPPVTMVATPSEFLLVLCCNRCEGPPHFNRLRDRRVAYCGNTEGPTTSAPLAVGSFGQTDSTSTSVSSAPSMDPRPR